MFSYENNSAKYRAKDIEIQLVVTYKMASMH